jgi:hypothetical protein
MGNGPERRRVLVLQAPAPVAALENTRHAVDLGEVGPTAESRATLILPVVVWTQPWTVPPWSRVPESRRLALCPQLTSPPSRYVAQPRPPVTSRTAW